MLRLILSILAGFIFTAILSSATDHMFHVAGIYPPYGEPFLDHGLLLMAFTYRAVFCIMGSFITAMIAKDQAKKAVLLIGAIGSSLWLVGAIVMWDFGPAWYNLGGIITGIPFALIGGKLHEMYSQKNEFIAIGK